MTAIAVVSVLGNVVIYNRFTTVRPLVMVGNHEISKREYLAVLDEDAGKQVLKKLVFAELVRQAAVKTHVMPTDGEVAARMTRMKAKDPKLASAVPEYKLRAAATSDMALENLRIQGVAVTPTEIARFYVAHKADFRQQGGVQAVMFVTENGTDAQTAEHLLAQGIDAGVIAKQPGFHLVGADGYTLDMTGRTREGVVRGIFAMGPGSVKTFPLDGQYMTVKVFSRQNAGVAPLAQVRDQVERLARLEKAPSAGAEILALYRENKPDFIIDKYAAFLQDVDQAAASSKPAR